jgi:hypothetical protein
MKQKPPEPGPQKGEGRLNFLPSRLAHFQAMSFFSVLISLFLTIPVQSQTPNPADFHRIRQRGSLSGSVATPNGMVPIKGEALVEYEERVLERAPTGEPLRTVRQYQKASLVREQAGQSGEGVLRPVLNPIVILRQGTTEVPFSPKGPMTLGEVDLLRTDVFVGALGGLLPPPGTAPGGSWKASDAAVRELTDLEMIQKGSIDCTFTPQSGTTPARVSFRGSVEGPQEEGLARHEITGSLEPDGLGGIRVLDMQASQLLLGPGGTERGRIAGRFALERTGLSQLPNLSDAALAGLKLTPDETNTRLQVEIAGAGLGFTMSRRWRVISQAEKQLRIALPGGAEVLMTLEGSDRLPGLGELVNEGKTQLQKENQKPGEPTNPVSREKTGVRFEYSALVAAKADGSQDRWVYGVVRLQNSPTQVGSGSLFACRFPRASWPFWDREIDELTRTGLSFYKLRP